MAACRCLILSRKNFLNETFHLYFRHFERIYPIHFLQVFINELRIFQFLHHDAQVVSVQAAFLFGFSCNNLANFEFLNFKTVQSAVVFQEIGVVLLRKQVLPLCKLSDKKFFFANILDHLVGSVTGHCNVDICHNVLLRILFGPCYDIMVNIIVRFLGQVIGPSVFAVIKPLVEALAFLLCDKIQIRLSQGIDLLVDKRPPRRYIRGFCN